MHWSDLLNMTRVIILAEAGIGKTHELRETARRLRREEKIAFFCRIEWLATDNLEHALSEGNAEEVRSWLECSHAAWFFLDSVDEARLANPQFFEKALRTLARALNHALSRAHIFITARVSDWRATSDLVLVKDVLPPSAIRDAVDTQRTEQDTATLDAETEVKPAEKGTQDDVQVVQLAPLTTDQMRLFAARQGVQDVAAFMTAIARADADIFAERPEDLLELIAYWNEHGSIGIHAKMIAFNIDKKLGEPNPDRDATRPLAQAKALEGAMLLAAALTLTRKNSILLPDRPVDPVRVAQASEPKELLRDWDARDIQTLLDRPLFDEATYGRVQFHHRSVREYLTARWLLHLLESGKPWSYSELVERLHNQLVGQYLRDTRSRFGVFLLVWQGTKTEWRESESGQRFRFDNLVEQLEAKAEEILAGFCPQGRRTHRHPLASQLQAHFPVFLGDNLAKSCCMRITTRFARDSGKVIGLSKEPPSSCTQRGLVSKRIRGFCLAGEYDKPELMSLQSFRMGSKLFPGPLKDF